MIGHYIEDDALDALALTGMLNGESGISLTTSNSMRDFPDWLGDGDLDFILVDIYRPDSLSFDEEVKRIRAHSHAPIFFITGDEAKYYESDALIVGAEGVLEKENLTPDGLVKALGNIPDLEPHSEENGLVKSGQDDGAALVDAAVTAAPDLERFEIANAYLGRVLETAAGMEQSVRDYTRALSAIAHVHSLLLAFMCGSEKGPAEKIAGSPQPGGGPVPQRIRHLQRASLAQAKQNGVKLTFQASADIFGGASAGRIDTAVQSILYAVIMGSAKGSTVQFNGMSNAAYGVRLSITSDAPFPFDPDDIILRKLPRDHAQFGPTILMTATAMLFRLSQEHFTIFQRGGQNTLLIDIQDS